MAFEGTIVRVRYTGGVFVPDEPVNIEEGTVTQVKVPARQLSVEERQAILRSLAGAWGDFEFVEINDPPLPPEDIFE